MGDVSGFIEWMTKIKNIHQSDMEAMGRAIDNLHLEKLQEEEK